MSFDYEKFKELQDVLKKQAQFVPVPPPDQGGGQQPGMEDPTAMAGGGMDPAAMASMDPAAMASMDPTAMAGGGMDPAATASMDPAAMAAADPAAMAGEPSPDDLSSGGDVSPSGEPYMKITPTQLSKLFKQFAEVFKSVLGIGAQGAAQPPVQAQPQVDQALQAKMTEIDAKLNALIGG